MYGTGAGQTSVNEYASSIKHGLEEEAYCLVQEKEELDAAHHFRRYIMTGKLHGKPYAPDDLE